jgi:hypothetical protein
VIVLEIFFGIDYSDKPWEPFVAAFLVGIAAVVLATLISGPGEFTTGVYFGLVASALIVSNIHMELHCSYSNS